MKTHGGAFLTSEPNRGIWRASRYGLLISMKITRGNHSLCRWVAPRAAVNAVEKGKRLPLTRIGTPISTVTHPIA